MKPITCKVLGFCMGSALTAVAWIAFWARSVPQAAAPFSAPETVMMQRRWSKERIASLISTVENANSDNAKLEACTDLLHIPIADAREILEQANLKNDRRLSLVTKILLIRWGASDGEAAIQWAWKRYRSEGLWDAAFREIAPAWAAHNPASIGKWALSAADKLKPAAEEPSMAEIETMEYPLVDSRMLTEISNWLVTEDPRLAYQLLKKRGGFSTDDVKMPLALTSLANIREALMAFDHLKINDPLKLQGDEIQIYYLLCRWHELDPDDFSRSAYAGSIIIHPSEETPAVIERWKSLPDEERARNASALVTHVIPEIGRQRISAIAQTWAETDPDATVRWLDSLPPETQISTNAARITVLAPRDPTAVMDWADRLPAGEQRQNLLVAAFDAWTKAHPGQHADRTDWPAERAQAWEDLEALQPPDRK